MSYQRAAVRTGHWRRGRRAARQPGQSFSSRLRLEEACVAVGQRANQLLVNVIGTLSDLGRYTLFVQRAHAGDFSAEPRCEIALPPALRDLRFVIQLDF